MSIKQGGNTIAGAVGKYPLNERNISNCITNIPQDIKLELNNGTLTLKAGSKVYVPSGAGVFNVLTIDRDITRTESTTYNNTYLIFYRSHSISIEVISNCYSGSTAPTASTNMNWYDTINNTVNRTSNGGSTWTSGYTLPIAVCTQTAGSGWVSIDQVFNGFGYIGSTIFALPGVKGLIPNGRNEDGTLASTELTLSSVVTGNVTVASTGHDILLRATAINVDDDNVYPNWQFEYYADENRIYNTGSGSQLSGIIIGKCFTDSSIKINSFITKRVYEALDYNDTEYIAHQAMPGNKYIDLTLGASGTNYTAPADGYVTLIKAATGVQQYIEMSTGQVFANMAAIYSGQLLYGTIPVSKGASFQINYNAGGSTNRFRFTYANGAK